MSVSSAGQIVSNIEKQFVKKNIPLFRTGDTVRVHAKIIEGNKERIQIFEGIVIRRHNGNLPSATFTVRKVSYNVGVERTFLLHSPRIERIEVTAHGIVKRARLYYLRPLRGKATKIKSQYINSEQEITPDQQIDSTEAASISKDSEQSSEGASSQKESKES